MLCVLCTELLFRQTCMNAKRTLKIQINPLNVKLNPVCLLLALFGAHHILHLSR